MPIRKLPEYMISRLKSGDDIERPASVVKELVENSLDAEASRINVFVMDGGKSLLSVEDDGVGIELTDMDLLLERYSTSKIYSEQDLLNLKSYGFRGEALARIAELSKLTIISKTGYSEIGTKLVKMGESLTVNHLPVGFEHGTMVSVQDLFYNVATKLKSLNSSQTEFFYCYNYFVDVALCHYDKSFALYKNNKSVFDLHKVDSLMDRITQIYKKDWSKNLKPVQVIDGEMHLTGFVSDSSLTFGSGDNIKIYVNARPVQDKIITRALMDAYARQIKSGEYPLAVLMLNAQPSANAYQIIYNAVSMALGANKHDTAPVNVSQSSGFWEKGYIKQEDADQNPMIGDYKVVGQLWDRYIVLQSDDGIYYIDQSSLADRISYEKMKKDIKVENNLKPDVLLQPLLLEIPTIADVDEKIVQIKEMGFDCSLFSENRVIVYAVPQIFVMHKVDLEKLFMHIFCLEKIDFENILNQILESKLFKTSIKTGDSLSLPEMIDFVKEGFDVIGDMFSPSVGKSFFVKSDKKELDKFFG